MCACVNLLLAAFFLLPDPSGTEVSTMKGLIITAFVGKVVPWLELATQPVFVVVAAVIDAGQGVAAGQCGYLPGGLGATPRTGAGARSWWLAQEIPNLWRLNGAEMRKTTACQRLEEAVCGQQVERAAGVSLATLVLLVKLVSHRRPQGSRSIDVKFTLIAIIFFLRALNLENRDGSAW